MTVGHCCAIGSHRGMCLQKLLERVVVRRADERVVIRALEMVPVYCGLGGKVSLAMAAGVCVVRRERCFIDLGGAVALIGAAADERGTETCQGMRH